MIVIFRETVVDVEAVRVTPRSSNHDSRTLNQAIMSVIEQIL